MKIQFNPSFKASPQIYMPKTNLPNFKAKNRSFLLIDASMYGDIEGVKRILKYEDVNVNVKDERGYTALMKASMLGYTEIVKELLKCEDIDVNIKDTKGNTALMMICTDTTEIGSEIAEELLKSRNIDVNIQNKNGNTALMEAILKKNEDFARLILNYGKVDFDIQNKNGDTALMLAKKKKRKNFIVMICEKQNREEFVAASNFWENKKIEISSERRIPLARA